MYINYKHNSFSNFSISNSARCRRCHHSPLPSLLQYPGSGGEEGADAQLISVRLVV